MSGDTYSVATTLSDAYDASTTSIPTAPMRDGLAPTRRGTALLLTAIASDMMPYRVPAEVAE